MDPTLILDFTHRNLQVHNVDKFLKEELQPILEQVTSRVEADLCYNHLDVVGLGTVVSFMERYPLLAVCIGYNDFSPTRFHSVVANLGHSQWIESNRIHLGTSKLDARFESLAALFEENSQQQRLQAEIVKDLGRAADVACNTNGWGTNVRNDYEGIIGCVFLEYLVSKGYKLVDTFPEKYCKIPFHVPLGAAGVDGVEWDSVYIVERNNIEYCFVVEAKMNGSSRDMLTMPDRIERTKSFKAYSRDPSDMIHATKADEARCYVWSVYRDSIVRGVIGADVLPQSVVDTVKAHNMVRISRDISGWLVVDEADASTLS